MGGGIDKVGRFGDAANRLVHAIVQILGIDAPLQPRDGVVELAERRQRHVADFLAAILHEARGHLRLQRRLAVGADQQAGADDRDHIAFPNLVDQPLPRRLGHNHRILCDLACRALKPGGSAEPGEALSELRSSRPTLRAHRRIPTRQRARMPRHPSRPTLIAGFEAIRSAFRDQGSARTGASAIARPTRTLASGRRSSCRISAARRSRPAADRNALALSSNLLRSSTSVIGFSNDPRLNSSTSTSDRPSLSVTRTSPLK